MDSIGKTYVLDPSNSKKKVNTKKKTMKKSTEIDYLRNNNNKMVMIDEELQITDSQICCLQFQQER